MERVKFEIEGGIGIITFRGERDINLINGEVIERLGRVLGEVEREPEARVVVIKGHGERAFSAGVDVKLMKDLSPIKAKDFISSLHSVMRRVMELPIPVIASIKGLCLGGGLELALACDVRIGAEDSVFGLPEIRVGIPSVIEASLLPRIVGWGIARELILTGKTIDAKRAYEIGLINKIVPGEKLHEETLNFAADFLDLSPFILKVQKDILRRWLETGYTEGVHYSIESFSLCFSTPHPREGMEAFLEKRKPSYPDPRR